MPARNVNLSRTVPWVLIALFCLSTALFCSCSKTKTGGDLTLNVDIHGFYLGESKNALFKRAKGIAEIKKIQGSPFDYRGELYRCSKALADPAGIDYVRLAFLENKLMEIVIYYRENDEYALEWLREELEGRFQTKAVAPDASVETAFKTYRLTGPGMSITIKRLTKVDGTELFVQYIHNELLRRLLAKKKAMGK
jgi:hypothetical protein